ncbi:MAG: hypothetical protein ACK56F_07810, partial [bacterium]
IDHSRYDGLADESGLCTVICSSSGVCLLGYLHPRIERGLNFFSGHVGVVYCCKDAEFVHVEEFIRYCWVDIFRMVAL